MSSTNTYWQIYVAADRRHRQKNTQKIHVVFFKIFTADTSSIASLCVAFKGRRRSRGSIEIILLSYSDRLVFKHTLSLVVYIQNSFGATKQYSILCLYMLTFSSYNSRRLVDIHTSCLSIIVLAVLDPIFFCERVVNLWNSLPDSVNFSSLPKFRCTVKCVNFSSYLKFVLFRDF